MFIPSISNVSNETNNAVCSVAALISGACLSCGNDGFVVETQRKRLRVDIETQSDEFVLIMSVMHQ